MKKEEIIKKLNEMPKDWREHWCENLECGCIGAANCSGGLTRYGVSKTEWEEAIKELNKKFLEN